MAKAGTELTLKFTRTLLSAHAKVASQVCSTVLCHFFCYASRAIKQVAAWKHFEHLSQA